MKRFFEAARHSFFFDLPGGHPLLGKLSQYEPFETAPAGSPEFGIELVEELPEQEAKMVYSASGDEGEPVIRLYRSDSGWAFEMAPYKGRPLSGRVQCDSRFELGKLQILCPQDALFALNNAAMLLFAFRTACMGTLEIHASVIENGGRAFLWMAKSGTGKSTHSRLWLEHVAGSRLLNDDNPLVRINPDGSVEVYGSPWSGKTPCYINRHYPAGAFCRINRSAENSISRMSPLESYALLYSGCSGFKADHDMAGGLHETIEKIVGSVPCYNIYCRPDKEAALVSSAELLKL